MINYEHLDVVLLLSVKVSFKVSIKLYNVELFIVDNFNVKKRLKFKHYLYICEFYIKLE